MTIVLHSASLTSDPGSSAVQELGSVNDFDTQQASSTNTVSSARQPFDEHLAASCCSVIPTNGLCKVPTSESGISGAPAPISRCISRAALTACPSEHADSWGDKLEAQQHLP